MNRPSTITASLTLMLLAASLTSGCATVAPTEESMTPARGFGARTANMQLHAGFIDFFWDDDSGKVWLAIEKWDEELLYVNYLSRGVGSNDLGLDRGQLGNTRVVRFQRVGPRVLLIEPNYDYRALSESDTERRAIEESFASSVLWSFEIAAEAGQRVLVDATRFLGRDAHGLARRLEARNEGSYAVDPERSVYFAERSRAFPENTEIEFLVTFRGEPRGQYVRQVTPTPQSLTVHMHHSFVALPDAGYEPRAFDPRSGYFGISFKDYATPIDEPLTRRYIARHRLEKKQPGAELSEAVQPIVYYVDAGAPSPVREALLDGARWWNTAFEAIGYSNAFRVEVLPDDADPMDVRYNVIQWVHRATRGWSYGASVIDPRTGEIIKGHVSLGSLRVRQDFLLAEGFLAPYDGKSEAPPALAEMALARLRQLSAHEVGHTLGLAHNFAASAQDRASVMDYPHPLVQLTDDGKIDVSNAYDSGIGAWDKFAIEFGYQDFPGTVDEASALRDIVSASLRRGQLYIEDADARVPGVAHPLANLWDNGSDPVAELDRMMSVRKVVLGRFSEKNIPADAPMATLEEALVPMYLMHRYQAEAAAKVLGGQTYTYALRGDGQEATVPLEAAWQYAALDSLLRTLSPQALMLPAGLAARIPGRPPGYPLHRETFSRRTGPVFDRLSPAETAASMTIDLLLQARRANRLVQFHAEDPGLPGLEQVLDALLDASWQARRPEGRAGVVQATVDHAVLDGIMRLASDSDAGELVRGKATARLVSLSDYLDRQSQRAGNTPVGDHYRYGKLRVARFLEDPVRHPPPPAMHTPPGSPIGDGAAWLVTGHHDEH